MKRYLFVLLALAIALPVVAGGKQESGGSTKSATSTQQINFSVIVRSYTMDQPSPWKTAAAVFEKEHPNVKVTYQPLGYDDTRTKTLLAVGAGQELDVTTADYIWTGEYAEGKILLPITDELNADPKLKNDIYPQFIEASSWKGQIYGLFLNTDIRILGWVKKYLSDAGINPDKAPETYAELVQNAMKAQKPPATSGYFFPLWSGENTAERWYGPLFSAGGQILNKDFTKAEFDSPAGVKALQFYVDAVNKYKIIPQSAFDSATNSDQLNWNQQLVYCYDFFAWEDAQKAGWSIDKFHSIYGESVPPKFEGGVHATTSGGYIIGIPRTARDKNLSWEFVKLATSPENVRDFYAAQARLGTRKSMAPFASFLEKSNPDYAVQAESLQYTHLPPWNPAYEKIVPALYSAIQSAVLLKASPKEALDKAAATTNSLLK